MFSFLKKKFFSGAPEAQPAQTEATPAALAPAQPAAGAGAGPVAASPVQPAEKPGNDTRQGWLERLRQGLRKTGSSISTVFTGTKIDEELYEELEAALLMADAGTQGTAYLLEDLRRRVKITDCP